MNEKNIQDLAVFEQYNLQSQIISDPSLSRWFADICARRRPSVQIDEKIIAMMEGARLIRKKNDDWVLGSAGRQFAVKLGLISSTSKITEELRIVGLIQRDFLPIQLPNTGQIQWSAVFLPAALVSSDIYDIVSIDEQNVGFYVADVVGHGVAAAILTVFVKHALSMRETIGSSSRILSPAEVMRNLNARMAAQKTSGYQFATCCYCLLNIETLQLTYARAGHPYPILIRSREHPQLLDIRGSLLGVFDRAEYTQKRIQLQPGDKLLLYTDGAESFLGSFDDQIGFNFSDEFCKIKNLPIVQMMEKFTDLVKTKKIDSSEVDDITVVGFELL